MRKILFLLLLAPVALFAQTAEFGYFSLSEVMDVLPEYKAAQDEYNLLLEHCDKEVARNEEELTRIYVSFLDGQQSFPEPILRKRQKELQDMIDRSIVMREQLKDWLSQAHDSLFSPIANKIDEAVERVCLRGNLAYAIDTDKAVYRFVNPNFGVKITDLVIQEVISPKPIEPVVEEATDSASDAHETDASEVNAVVKEENHSVNTEELSVGSPIIEIVTE